jgi:sulfite exporter TauE/SafE
MIEVVGAVLAASLLGSPHCAGMCGGFVCFYSGQGGGSRWDSHLAYHGGRLLSYLGLGLGAGLFGAGLDRIGAAAGWTRPAALAAGSLMIVWGGVTLLRARGIRIPLPRAPVLHRASRRLVERLLGHPPVSRALLLGLLTTLLPCGWLYAFVATAAGTGSVPAAMLVMGAFWLGTLPLLAGLGLASQRAFGPLRRHLPAVTATALMIIGLLTLTGRLGGAGPGTPRPAAHLHDRR